MGLNGLPHQIVPIPLGMGLDQKTDAKQVLPGKLVTAKNCRFSKTGRLDPRPGFTNRATLSGTIDRVYGHGPQPIAFVEASGGTGERIKAYDSAAESWRDICEMPTVPRAKVSRFLSLNNLALFTAPKADCAINGDYICAVTWASGTPGHFVYISIIDATTMKIVGTISSISLTSGNGGHVVAIPGTSKFCVTAINITAGATSVVIYEVDPSTMTATGKATIGEPIPGTDLSHTYNGQHDVAAFDSCLVVAAVERGDATVRVAQVDWSSWSVNWTTFALTASGGVVGVAVPTSPASANVLIMAQDGASTIRFKNYVAASLSLNYSSTRTTTGGGTRSLTGIEDSEDATYPYKVFSAEPISGLNPTYTSLVHLKLNASGSPTNLTSPFYGMSWSITNASKPIQVDGRIYFWTRFYDFVGSDTQTMILLCEYGLASPKVRLLNDAVGQDSGTFPSSLIPLPDGSYASAVVETTSPTTSARVLISFEVDPSSGWQAIESDDGALLFSGGFLTSFDGVNCGENGFLAYPMIGQVTTDNSGGSKTGGGTYVFVIVFERIDACGRVHRSPPSNPYTVTLGGGDNNIRVVFQALAQTANATGVSAVFYCTTDGGSVYYREAAVACDYGSDFANQTQRLTSSDATISVNETLYTSGNIKDDTAVDAPTAIALGPTRLYGVAGSRLSAMQPAKEFLFGIAPGFYPDVSEPIHIGEEIKGLAWIAGRIFAFKERSAFSAFGEGPDLTGSNDTLSSFEVFSRDVGLADAASLVSTTLGAVFLSHRGFYLLGRDGGLLYIGADVEDLIERLPGAVIDAAFSEDNREIKFLLSGGETVLTLTLYETKEGIDWRWSSDDYSATPLSAIASVGGEFVGVWNDNGTAHFGYLAEDNPAGDFGQSTGVLPVFETGWLSFAGLQGFQRLRALYVLGALLPGVSSVDLSVDIAYDYVDSYGETRTITSANATYGSSQYQAEIRPLIQKCQAVKLRFRPSTWGLSLSGLEAEIAIKGRARLPSQKGT